MANKRKLEIVVIITIIVIATGLLWVKANLASKNINEKTLIHSLKATRTSVQLYLTINKSLPPDLKTLTTQKYTLGNQGNFYLTGVNVNNESTPMDPFGSPFNYDAKTGKVWSKMPKYLEW